MALKELSLPITLFTKTKRNSLNFKRPPRPETLILEEPLKLLTTLKLTYAELEMSKLDSNRSKPS